MATLTTNTSIAGVPRLIWETLTTAGADGPDFKVEGQRALAGCVQVIGTFGGATITLRGSNDGTNYFTLKDLQGNDISFTATGAAEFSTSAAYISPASSGGSGDDVDVILVLRG